MKVLTFADLHLRGTVPSCVNETPTKWMEIQKQALNKVVFIAVENGVEGVYVGGDIFHSETSCTFECINMFIDFVLDLKNAGIPVFVLFGNHDLYGHSSEYISKSAVGILQNHPYIHKMTSEESYIHGCDFDKDNYDGHSYIFKHVLCIPKEQKADFIECETPETLLGKFPKARYIFTGDYHQKFAYQNNGRFVINSGCLTKQASDFKDYETGVFVVDTNINDIKWCPVNIPQKFVENGNKKADKTIEDFANGIKKETVTLDFVSTLKKESESQKKPIRDKVDEWIKEIGQ